MKFQTVRLLLALLVAAMAAPAALAQEAKSAAGAKGAAKPLAKVNGAAIPQMQADILLLNQRAQGAPEDEQTRDRIREELIRRELIAQEARKKGLDKKPEITAQMDMARQATLVQAYLQDYARSHPISDEAIKKEYETVVARLGDKEYKVRHILVEKDDEAKAVIVKLKAGERFEELAKQSKDPGSKERGGDLGWSSPANYVKPFADALVKLDKGKYTTEPVKTDFGYHVILLEDVRERKTPPLDEVKPQINEAMQRQAIARHIADLRAKAKVE